MTRVNKAIELIRQHSKFILTTHALPDGDGLGAEMALYHFLMGAGKQCRVLNSHGTAPKFQCVDPLRKIEVFDSSRGIGEAEVIFVLDTSEWKMLGPLEKPIRASKAQVVFLDHHIPSDQHGAHFVIDQTCSSTGELVFRLLKLMKSPIDTSMAIPLYVALMTDTGSFRYRRTSPGSHLMAAELLEKGVRPDEVYESVYACDSVAKTRLLGHLLEAIQISADGRIAWLSCPKTLRSKYGATVEDTESFVNQLTLMENVEIGILFREEDSGEIKLSFRGNRGVKVIDIAKRLGGGGHLYAAGAKLQGSLSEVIGRVVKVVEKELKRVD